MKTISTHVKEHIKLRPLLVKHMRQGIINYRSLAELIQPEISSAKGEDVSVGSIAVTLQRMSKTSESTSLIPMIGQLRGVSIVSNVNLIVLPISNASLISSGTQFISTVRGMKEMSIIISNDSLGSALKKLPDNHTLLRGLSAVVIERTGDHHDIPGGLAYPINLLLENNIPIVCVNSTENEELILMKDRYVDRAGIILRKAVAL